MKTQLLKNALNNGLLQDIDIQFAGLMCRLAGSADDVELFLAAALASNITTDGKHVCLDLKAVAGKPLAVLFPDSPQELPAGDISRRLPSLAAWTRTLSASPVVGSPGEYTPLILDRCGRLYLQRYFNYEQHLAGCIRRRAGLTAAAGHAVDLARRDFDECFSHSASVPDWQKVAVFAALTRNVCVISGGPGTGKTHTVGALLRLLLKHTPDAAVRLCAPTGKAANRLAESLRGIVTGRGEVCAGTVATIHRLLGFRPHSATFQHTEANPLAADIVIVDEASMVPLALMAKLFQAIPQTCRIVLLGDKYQLASVEAGCVFGDICEAAQTGSFSRDFCRQYARAGGEEIPAEYQRARASALTDCAVELQHSYRFASSPAIGALSAAINAGDVQGALAAFEDDAGRSIVFKALPGHNEYCARLAAVARRHYGPMLASGTPGEACGHFNSFRILCPYRQGFCGVENTNTLIEQALYGPRGMPAPQVFYRSRPVMITRNEYALKLFNGDTGICWESPGGERAVCFPEPGNTFRRVAPGRLPAHETAYAMTIHKAQGSEFDTVLIILPAADSPLLTREIIYTGVTRARARVEIWAPPAVFSAALRRQIERTSGLRDALLAPA